VTVAVEDASPAPPRLLPLDVTRPGGFRATGKTVTAVVRSPTGVKRQL
jgi:hypothetical protein